MFEEKIEELCQEAFAAAKQMLKDNDGRTCIYFPETDDSFEAIVYHGSFVDDMVGMVGKGVRLASGGQDPYGDWQDLEILVGNCCDDDYWISANMLNYLCYGDMYEFVKRNLSNAIVPGDEGEETDDDDDDDDHEENDDEDEEKAKYGIIDKSGKFIVEPKFDEISYFSEGIARVAVDFKWGYIDKSGKIIIDPKFAIANDFSDGVAAVYIDGKWGYIDKSGKYIIEPKFELAGEFSDGVAEVQIDGDYCCIDKSGKIIVEPKFDFVYAFSDGIAKVEVDGKYGYIDKTGKIVVEPKFDKANDFADGMAVVSL